jgi:RHS repeat-associated protein
VPEGAQSFTYNGEEYGPGDSFTSANPCEVLGFAEAFQAANPDGGTEDGSPNFWQKMREACPAGTVTDPAATDAGIPDERDQSTNGGDSADAQGAPDATGPLTEGQGDAETGEGGGAAEDPPPTEEPKRPPEGEVQSDQVRETPQEQVLVADPVDVFSGAYYTREVDLEVPGTLIPLAFVRIYRSGTPTWGPLGWNWDHNLNVYLRELSSGDVAIWRSLHEDVFTSVGAGFEPPRGVFEQLERVGGGGQEWLLRGVEGGMLHFERPPGWVDGERIPLVRIEDRHGNALQLTYGAEDSLVEVRDDDDRALRFAYDDCGLLVAVEDHAGRRFTYTHDEESFHLATVTTPATADHPQGITRTYHYADPWSPPQLRHNIVRLEDAEGNAFVETAYDEDPASLSFARVTEQLFGGHLYQYRYTQVQAVPPAGEFVNVPAWRVEVMNPDFGVETYTFNFRGDLLDERLRLVKDRSFRVVALQYEYDEQGNRTAVTKPDGSQELYLYDAANADPRMRGLMLRRELTAASGFPAPSRIVERLRYEPAYQLLVEHTSESGAITEYEYDFDLTPGAADNTGKLKRVKHPDVVDPDGGVQSAETRYEHASDGQLTAVVTPDGARTELEYGTAGPDVRRLVKKTVDVGGLDLEETYAHDAFGFRSRTTNAAGTVETTFNALGKPERVLAPAVAGSRAEREIHYDRDLMVSRATRPRGTYDDAALAGAPIEDRFERDVLGHPVTCVLAANTATPRAVRTQYDHRGFPLVSVNPDGARIERVYDERGLLVVETVVGVDGARQQSRDHYDRSGRRTHRIAPGDVTTRYEYDGFGRVQHVHAPNGTEFSLTWDEGDVLTRVGIEGRDDQGAVRLLSEQRFEYDAKGRQIREIVRAFDDDPAASVDVVTELFFDETDRLVKEVGPRGATTSYTYDGAGRMTSTTDPVGNVEERDYDANGNLTLVRRLDVEPDGSTSTIETRFEYDVRDRLVATLAPDGSRHGLDYDDRDLVVGETAPDGVETEVAYDAFGARVRETRDPGGLAIEHRWELDELARVTVYTDPTGSRSTYERDGLGRSVRTEYANGFTSTRTFDAAGNVLVEQLASGTRFEYDYDAASRPTRIRAASVPAGVAPVADLEFEYDGMDRMTRAASGASEVRRRYDSQDRLSMESSGGASFEQEFNDLAGRLTRTWPDGRAERVVSDVADRPVEIEETSGGVLGSGAATIATLSASGPDRVGTVTLGAGVDLEASYDDRKRLVRLAASAAGGLDERVEYRYDVADRRRVEAIAGVVDSLKYFEFDEGARLTRSASAVPAAVPAGSSQPQQSTAIAAVAAAATGDADAFDYDPADAREKAAHTGSPDVVYVNDAGHRPVDAGPEAFTYSPDGVRASDGNFTYEQDALGRIVRVIDSGADVCRIDYDALGRPSAIREGPAPPRMLHWFGDDVVQESVNGAPARQHTLHPTTGIPLAHHVTGATQFPLFDGRMNLLALVDDSGTLLESYRYAPFGVPVVFNAAGNVVATSGFDSAPIFGGQRYVPSAGLYLATRRLMDPRHGVFLSQDPLGFASSPSLYAYSAQDPVDLVDPHGELAFLAILGVMAVGALIGGGINVARQHIQMAENPARRAQGFSWSELGISMGIGAVAAPILVVAPELAIPLAAVGIAGGANEIANGNTATGVFDIATSILPFGSKGVRNASIGRGTYIGQWRGLGQATPWASRTGRFDQIQKNWRAFLPAPGGRRVGIGYARTRGDTQGHSGVFIDEPQGPTLYHKNGQRAPEGGLEASWQLEQPLPSEYPGRQVVPWEYESIRVPRSLAEAMSSYARGRMSQREPFAFGTRSCGNFTSDVLGAGGFRGIASPDRSGGVFRNFTGLLDAINMTYASGFWANGHSSVPNRKCVPVSE